MQIILISEIEGALVEQAKNKGIAPETFAIEVLRERLVTSEGEKNFTEGKETLADYLVNHIGVLSSGELQPEGS